MHLEFTLRSRRPAGNAANTPLGGGVSPRVPPGRRGFSHVTVEDIAAAADVSPRTFFNYFPSKEAVVFGADPDRTAALRERIAHAAPGESALAALRVVMADDAQAVAEELSDLGGDPADWLDRMKEARADPNLRAAQAAQMAMTERAIAEGLAERLGTDPERDAYPALLAATATGSSGNSAARSWSVAPRRSIAMMTLVSIR